MARAAIDHRFEFVSNAVAVGVGRLDPDDDNDAVYERVRIGIGDIGCWIEADTTDSIRRIR
jgi:hypothetical protein